MCSQLGCAATPRGKPPRCRGRVARYSVRAAWRAGQQLFDTREPQHIRIVPDARPAPPIVDAMKMGGAESSVSRPNRLLGESIRDQLQVIPVARGADRWEPAGSAVRRDDFPPRHPIGRGGGMRRSSRRRGAQHCRRASQIERVGAGPSRLPVPAPPPALGIRLSVGGSPAGISGATGVGGGPCGPVGDGIMGRFTAAGDSAPGGGLGGTGSIWAGPLIGIGL